MMDAAFAILLTDRRAYVAGFEREQHEWVRTSLEELDVDLPVLPQEATELTSIAGELAQRIRSEHPDGLTCRLIVPASWCLTHTVRPPPKQRSKQAAAFEFEQYLPVDLEELTCCSKRTSRTTALVMGVFTASLRAFLDTLHESDIIVESVSLDVMAVASDRANDEGDRAPGVILVDDTRMTIALHHDRAHGVCDFRSSPILTDGPEAVLRQQALMAAYCEGSFPSNWRVFTLAQATDCAETLATTLRRADGQVKVYSREESVHRLLHSAIGRDDVVDLRTDKLAYAGRWTRVVQRATGCAIAAAVLLLALGLQLRVDNLSYAATMDEFGALRTRVYGQAFPGEPAPPGAALRLRSECIKLEGLTERTVIETSDLRPNSLGTFDLLHDVTSAIPANLRLYVNEILVDDRGIRLAGQTTSHAAAGELVQQLNAIEKLVVDPPRTKLRKDQTVDFRIRAERQTDDGER
ncbi:MAG: hypothetical protein PVI86_16685 [Phycisphaerae bacterium]|jgi:hypothetical protein